MEHVVIIGAGPAGLSAAYRILQRGNKKYEVTVLESTGEIGGISRTVPYNGHRMDIGGHRFFTKDQEVKKWWQELLPLQGALAKDDRIRGRNGHLTEGGPDPEAEDEVMLKRQRISRIFYQKKFFDYPVTLNAATVKNLGFLTCMEAGLSYLKSCIAKRTEDNLENFYINRFGRKLYSIFFETYTGESLGTPSIPYVGGLGRAKGKRAVCQSSIKGRTMPGHGEGTGEKGNLAHRRVLVSQVRAGTDL